MKRHVKKKLKTIKRRTIDSSPLFNKILANLFNNVILIGS